MDMEWLSNLLGFTGAGGGSSPFGQLGSALGIPTGPAGGANSNVAGPPAPQQGNGMPGIFGKFLNQQQPGGAMPGAQSSGQNQMLTQALKLLQPQPMQPPPQMKLLTGPGPGGA